MQVLNCIRRQHVSERGKWQKASKHGDPLDVLEWHVAGLEKQMDDLTSKFHVSFALFKAKVSPQVDKVDLQLRDFVNKISKSRSYNCWSLCWNIIIQLDHLIFIQILRFWWNPTHFSWNWSVLTKNNQNWQILLVLAGFWLVGFILVLSAEIDFF